MEGKLIEESRNQENTENEKNQDVANELQIISAKMEKEIDNSQEPNSNDCIHRMVQKQDNYENIPNHQNLENVLFKENDEQTQIHNKTKSRDIDEHYEDEQEIYSEDLKNKMS